MRFSDSPLAGVLSALGCFSLWGLFPIYFKALGHVSAWEVLAHRVLWSAIVLLAFLGLQGRLRELWAEFRNYRHLRLYGLTTLLLSGNWLLYIWAVQKGWILEASFGYYINPLVNIVLGVLFLNERMNRHQWLAVALAAVGVLVLMVGYGIVPWISLTLALSFGGYGMLRKKAGRDATIGLCVEAALLAPGALLFLALLAFGVGGKGALGMVNWQTDVLLVSAGLITVVPLLLFLEAGRRLRLSTVGLIQYLTPTLQFLLAVFLYREPFTNAHLIAFGCTWVALALYSTDAWLGYRRQGTMPSLPSR